MVFRSADPQKNLWGSFLMIDLDQFQEVNGQYGCPESVRTLKAVADSLKNMFGHRGMTSGQKIGSAPDM